MEVVDACAIPRKREMVEGRGSAMGRRKGRHIEDDIVAVRGLSLLCSKLDL